MRILVTGGAGYIGCRLVPLLLDAGHAVRLFDRFCFGEEPIAAFQERCEVVRGDIRRQQEVPDLLNGIDAVVHLAGLVNDPSCLINAEMAHDVNVDSTRELAHRASGHGVKRFVLVSTLGVYGQGVFDVLDEASSTNPVSVYAGTMLEAEQALLETRGGDFEPVVARIGSLFGWSPRMRFDLGLNHMVATARKEGFVNIYGGGEQWRSFLHVLDACEAIRTLLEAPAEKASGEIFNIGSEAGNRRIGELAEHVAKSLGDLPVKRAPGDADMRTFRATYAKAEKVLGIRCERTIDDGITEIRDGLTSLDGDPFDDRFLNAPRMRHLLDTPVDQGGEPAVPRFIPLYKPTLDVEEENAVLDALRGGWLTSGPKLKQFEADFAKVVHAPHVIGTISCTAALHLCLVHFGVGPGDEVITSPITWASTGNTVAHMGAKLVLADVLPGTLNIDPADVARKITPRTKAIMPVHLAGQPCDLEAIYALGREHGIPVVEDAAHALGASYKGTPIGGCGDFACFSFYAIKNITTMEGGVVCCRDEEAARHIRLLATNGMSATAWDRYGRSAAPAPPVVVEPGYKYLMGNVSAAMGIVQLKKLNEFQAARQRLARLYEVALRDIEEIEVPEQIEGIEHAWHLIIIKLRLDQLRKTRDEIAADLRKENVGTSVHFFGLHLHPYFQEWLGIQPEDLPNATKISNSILSLPLFPRMTDRDVYHVVEALKKVLHHARK